MIKTETFYRKEGRKYIPIHRCDINGVSEGLWLVIKNKYSEEYSNLLCAVKTHDIQNVGKFADFYKAYKEEIENMVKEQYYLFFSEEGKTFSINDLTKCIIAGLSKIN